MKVKLDEHIQKAVDAGESGLNIIHGHLKTLMLNAENQIMIEQETENGSEKAINSMTRIYWEGVLESLTNLYKLTYDLSFAIMEREGR